MSIPEVLGADKIAEKLGITAAYVLGKIKDTVEKACLENNAPAVLKGTELLGKHLRLFGENAVLPHGVEFSIGAIPAEALAEERARAAERPPATPVLEAPKVEEKLVITVPNKLVN